MIELMLGGARSGKSAFAERLLLAEASGPLTYIATAAAGDGEMADRIAHHRRQRDCRWRLVEEPIALAAAITTAAADGSTVLVDCLTLWLTNLLLVDAPTTFAEQTAALLDVVERRPGRIAFVSNEVGQGVVPADALSRRFVDESGRLHQQLAARCDRVWWVVAGLPQLLKDASSQEAAWQVTAPRLSPLTQAPALQSAVPRETTAAKVKPKEAKS